MMKMKENGFIVLLAILCCSLALTGCKDTESEEAIAEAANAKAESAKVKSALAKTEAERDELRVLNETQSKRLQEVSADLSAAKLAADQLQKQIDSITEARDAAFAKAKVAEAAIEKLRAELEGKSQKVAELQDQNNKLQGTIKELQNKLKEVKLPSVPQL